ncbi:hypothetical protein SVAN01_06735 [Stagonosporopsis vannaccii]|nr:hypothetical protein SVAN01_06735 [Stagonosporopsis vannaccii]
MRQTSAEASLETKCRSLKRCLQKQSTARSDGSRQSPATLAASADRAHKDAIRGAGGMRVLLSRCCFRAASASRLGSW